MPESRPSVGNKSISSGVVSILVCLLMLAIVSLWVGWCVRQQHLTTYNFLVNLAAGFAVLFVATSVALILGRSKLKQTAVPILKLIQQLESENKITQEAARKSVVAVVAVLSEGNVSRAIERDPNSKLIKCPVCWLDVELTPQNRCKHCLLPDALWNSKELIENAPPRKRERQ
jgi:hypothetical protein